MVVQDIHGANFATVSRLSGFAMPESVPPINVVTVLNAAGVRFMLVGAYGIGGWTKKSRATEDVDVVVAARGHKKALASLLAAFPYLHVDDHPVVTRLRNSENQKVEIDLIKPIEPLFREAFKHSCWVEVKGQRYQIPSLELAIAMKFAAMISLNRADPDRYLDAHDFLHMIRANSELDTGTLAKLGQLVYDGGGKEIVEKVRKVLAGEKLSI